MHHPRTPSSALLAALALAALPHFAVAQSAGDVLTTAMERYEERVRSIETYTVVQEVMGTDLTLRYTKEIVDGRPVFRARYVHEEEQLIPLAANDVVSDLSGMIEHASYGGRHDVDGHATHAIQITEAGLASLSEAMARDAGGESFEARSMTMYVDAEEYVLRRVEMEGEMTQGDQVRAVATTIDFTDYRDVDGLLHPFRTTLSVEGTGDGSGGMSEEEMEEARKQIAEFDEQMAEMPEAQRAMIRRMMGDRIDQLRGMVEAGGGTSFTVEVKEVRVNAGAPGQG